MSDFTLTRGRQYNRRFDFSAPTAVVDRPLPAGCRVATTAAKLTEAETLALAHELLAEHGFAGLPIKLTGAVRTMGAAVFYGGQPVRLELSRKVIRHCGREEVLDTILHEIAHLIAGLAAGHGPAWKAAALRVGARPVQYVEASVMPPAPIAVCCGLCGDVLTRRHRTPKADWLARHSCRKCGRQSRGQLVARRDC